MIHNPFVQIRAAAGDGTIYLASLSSTRHVLKDLNYQYPLKLIAPEPSETASNSCRVVYTVFVLTYGGGLVGGDSVNLSVKLESHALLVLLTQGSTKVFKSSSPSVVTRQQLDVALDNGASLCYLPEPVQPFARSCFEQRQVYKVRGKAVSLCVLDWVSEGRPARQEQWDFFAYTSRNEIWRCWPEQEPILMIRDNLILDNETGNVQSSMHQLGVYGTLIIGGPCMSKLASRFLEEFRLLPRIGARKWDDADENIVDDLGGLRSTRMQQEAQSGVLWTAAATRGFVVVKFGAREVEGGKRWLHSILAQEGSVEQTWGERALLCLR